MAFPAFLQSMARHPAKVGSDASSPARSSSRVRSCHHMQQQLLNNVFFFKANNEGRTHIAINSSQALSSRKTSRTILRYPIQRNQSSPLQTKLFHPGVKGKNLHRPHKNNNVNNDDDDYNNNNNNNNNRNNNGTVNDDDDDDDDYNDDATTISTPQKQQPKPAVDRTTYVHTNRTSRARSQSFCR